MRLDWIHWITTTLVNGTESQTFPEVYYKLSECKKGSQSFVSQWQKRLSMVGVSIFFGDMSRSKYTCWNNFELLTAL